jgi:3-methyladenine DNA glycosylase AlkD
MTPAAAVERVVAELIRGGDRERARGIQRYFAEPITAHGWKTAALRSLGARLRGELIAAGGEALLWQVAEALFGREVLEEKLLGVFLLERSAKKLGAADLDRLEPWTTRIRTWADCDALGGALLSPLLAREPSLLPRIFSWAASSDRWQRRAAAVALIHPARQKRYTAEIFRLSDALLGDEDDMVRKGLGWLLRELGKKSPELLVPYLLGVKARAPRLVLRTACERLSAADRERVLAR